MAKVAIILDERRKLKKSGLFPLVLRISHQTFMRIIPLNLSLSKEQWNASTSEVKKIKNSARETARVHSKLSIARNYLIENQRAIEKLDINELKRRIEFEIVKKPDEELFDSAYLAVYGKVLMDRILLTGKLKTANWYRDAIHSIVAFNDGKDILLTDISSTFLENYKANCLNKKQSKNSINARLRALRALMNKGRNESGTILPKSHNPFSSVKIPSEKTKKRAVSKEVINIIREAELEIDTPIWHNRNYFLFMFNMQGMNFIDLAKLKWKQINKGRLTYVRSKTNKAFDIKLTEEAEQILAYYQPKKRAGGYVFPILSNNIAEYPILVTKTSDQALHLFNGYMNKLAQQCGIEERITSYVARHSWASAARKMGVSTDKIGDALGHESYDTTEVYLQDFDSQVLDDMNADVTSK